jgi:hypothetical protein
MSDNEYSYIFASSRFYLRSNKVSFIRFYKLNKDIIPFNFFDFFTLEKTTGS